MLEALKHSRASASVPVVRAGSRWTGGDPPQEQEGCGSDRVARILGRHKGKEGAEVGTGLEFEEGFPPTFLYVSCLCFPG